METNILKSALDQTILDLENKDFGPGGEFEGFKDLRGIECYCEVADEE